MIVYFVFFSRRNLLSASNWIKCKIKYGYILYRSFTHHPQQMSDTVESGGKLWHWCTILQCHYKTQAHDLFHLPVKVSKNHRPSFPTPHQCCLLQANQCTGQISSHSPETKHTRAQLIITPFSYLDFFLHQLKRVADSARGQILHPKIGNCSTQWRLCVSYGIVLKGNLFLAFPI